MTKGKSSILFKYSLSTLFLVAIFIIPMVFVSAQSIASVYDNTTHYVQTMLRQKQEIIDLHMEKINALINDLSLNARIINYAYSSPDESAFYDKMRLAMTELSRAKATNDFVYEIAMFHHKGGKQLISSGVYDQQNMQKLVMPFEGVSFEEWEKEITSCPSFAPARRLSTAPFTSILCMYQPYPNYEKADQVTATLILMIDANQLSDILIERSAVSKNATYILDRNGNVLLSTGEERYHLGNMPENTEDMFVLRTENNGEKVFHIGIHSAQNAWTYVYSVAEDSLFASAKNVKLSMIALIGSVLVFGIGLCVVQVRSHYSPIRDTVIQLEQAGAGKMSGNEIQYISTAITQQVQTIDDLNSRLNSYLPILRSSIRYQLLYGEFENNNELAKALADVSIRFAHPYFCVILVDIEMMNEDSDVSPAMLKLLCKEMVDKLFRQYGSAHALSVGTQRMAILLNTENMTDKAFQALMEKLLTEIKHHLMSKYMAELIAGVSSLLPGMENIHNAYLEAQGTLEYYNYNPSNWVYFWKAISSYREYVAMDAVSDKQLLNAIKSGDKALTERELDIYLQSFPEQKNLSLQSARYIFYRLMSDIHHLLIALDADMNESFQQSESIQSLLSCKNMSELIASIRRIVMEICETFSEKYRADGGQLVEKLKQYIIDNYADINLSLSSVSEYFKLTPTYIAHILRQQGNSTFLELVRKERIDHAKQLLSDTDLSINDIARNVGYADSVALGRNFKKELLMTPGQFREQNAR